MSTRSEGSAAESQAEQFLLGLGWRIFGRNLHYGMGEIDILAAIDEWVVVVEVKAKKTYRYGSAAEMITPSKMRTLRRLAQIIEKEYNKPIRIDVITIDGWATSQPCLTHYPFAVGDS